MKLLLIDTFSGLGHTQFNSIQINALKEIGHSITLVGKKNHYPNSVSDVTDQVYIIPNCLYNKDYKNLLGTVWDTFWEILRLLYIRVFILNRRIDRIVFLRYNVFGTLFFPTRKICYLFDHYSATEIENPFKRKIVSFYPRNFIHLGLNDNISEHIKTLLPNKTTKTVSHGFLPSFDRVDSCSYVSLDECFVFCAASSSCDETLLHSIISSPAVNKYLSDNRIKLLIKSKQNIVSNDNIKAIKGFINNDDYKYLICNALSVLLPYDKSFGYRVSGVFFECVANNISVIATNIPSFSVYKGNGQPLFLIDSEDDFLKALNGINGLNKQWSKELFDPGQQWKELLQE